MAKNWTIAEALEAIRENDKSKMQDIGKRFPLTSVLLARGRDTDAFMEFASVMPEYVTARKIETALAEGVDKFEDDTTDADTNDKLEPEPKAEPEPADKPQKDAKPGKKMKPKPAPADDGKKPIDKIYKVRELNENYTTKETRQYLSEIIDNKNKSFKNKYEMAKYIVEDNKKNKAKDKADKPAKAEPQAEPTPESSNDGLEGKTAKELYQIAKDMKLNPEPKKSKEEYLELINSVNDAVDEPADDGDDWDDIADDDSDDTNAKGQSNVTVIKDDDSEDDDDSDWDI